MFIRFFLCSALAAILAGVFLGASAKPAAAKTPKPKPAATQTVVLDVTGMH